MATCQMNSRHAEHETCDMSHILYPPPAPAASVPLPHFIPSQRETDQGTSTAPTSAFRRRRRSRSGSPWRISIIHCPVSAIYTSSKPPSEHVHNFPTRSSPPGNLFILFQRRPNDIQKYPPTHRDHSSSPPETQWLIDYSSTDSVYVSFPCLYSLYVVETVHYRSKCWWKWRT